MVLKRHLKAPRSRQKFLIPTNAFGLNREDQERIREVGFSLWWEEACTAQEKRIEERIKTKKKRITTGVPS